MPVGVRGCASAGGSTVAVLYRFSGGLADRSASPGEPGGLGTLSQAGAENPAR